MMAAQQRRLTAIEKWWDKTLGATDAVREVDPDMREALRMMFIAGAGAGIEMTLFAIEHGKLSPTTALISVQLDIERAMQEAAHAIR